MTKKYEYWNLPKNKKYPVLKIFTSFLVTHIECNDHFSACDDLINQCLQLDPNRRIKLEDILSHPWMRRDLTNQEATNRSTFFSSANTGCPSCTNPGSIKGHLGHQNSAHGLVACSLPASATNMALPCCGRIAPGIETKSFLFYTFLVHAGTTAFRAPWNKNELLSISNLLWIYFSLKIRLIW